jgi:hypothetical protein
MFNCQHFVVYDLLPYGIQRGHLEFKKYHLGQAVYQFCRDEQSAEYITIVPGRCRPIQGVTIVESSILYDGTPVYLVSITPPAVYKTAGGILISIDR